MKLYALLRVLDAVAHRIWRACKRDDYRLPYDDWPKGEAWKWDKK